MLLLQIYSISSVYVYIYILYVYDNIRFVYNTCILTMFRPFPRREHMRPPQPIMRPPL